MKNGQQLALFALFLAFLVALHQYIFYQVWFELKDVHHEGIILFLIGLAIGLLVAKKR
jgi:hypothetical protein